MASTCEIGTPVQKLKGTGSLVSIDNRSLKLPIGYDIGASIPINLLLLWSNACLAK